MTEQERQRAIRLKLTRQEENRGRAMLATGFALLDSAIQGGLPRGQITELFGAPSSGKTTLALQIVTGLQQTGFAAAWIDAEHCFDPAYAARLGLILEKLPVVRPETAEQCLEIARQLAGSGALDLLVIDSAAALVPSLELQIGLGEGGPGLQSRVLGSGLRKLISIAARTETAIFVLNQVRAGGASGDMEIETSAGGPPLKNFAALRIALEPSAVDRVRFRIVKNRSAGAFRRGELILSNGAGFVKTA